MPAPIVAAAGKAVAATGKVIAKTAAAVAKATAQVTAKIGTGLGKAAATTAKSAGQATVQTAKVATQTTTSVAKGAGQASASTAKGASQHFAKGSTTASQSAAKAPAPQSSKRSTSTLQERARALKQKQQVQQATTTLVDGVRGLIKAYGNAATGHGIDGTMQFQKINGQQGPQWNAEVKPNGDVLISDVQGKEVAQFNLHTKEVKQPLSAENAQAFVKAGRAYHAQKTQQPTHRSPAKSIAPKRQRQIQV